MLAKLRNWVPCCKKPSHSTNEQLLKNGADIESGSVENSENFVPAERWNELDGALFLCRHEVREGEGQGVLLAKPVESQTRTQVTNFMLFVFIGTMIESVVLGDMCINNSDAANYLNNTLPSHISHTGTSVVISILAPVIFVATILLGKSCLCSNKSKEVKVNQLAVTTNKNKFREFFCLYLATQSLKIMASMEKDFSSTNNISNFMIKLPGTSQILQFGIGSLLAYLIKVKTPRFVRNGAHVNLAIKFD